MRAYHILVLVYITIRDGVLSHLSPPLLNSEM